jgi:hypothetical protein
MVPAGTRLVPTPWDPFSAGNVQSVVSASLSIRIFGKRFMESEMASILVKVDKMFLG